MRENPSRVVRIADGVHLLKPAVADSVRVYLIAANGRIAIVACVRRGIAARGTQWEVGE